MRTSVTGSSLPPVRSLNAGRMIRSASPASRRRRPARRRHLRSRTDREAGSRRAPRAGTHLAQPPPRPRRSVPRRPSRADGIRGSDISRSAAHGRGACVRPDGENEARGYLGRAGHALRRERRRRRGRRPPCRRPARGGGPRRPRPVRTHGRVLEPDVRRGCTGRVDHGRRGTGRNDRDRRRRRGRADVRSPCSRPPFPRAPTAS